MGRQDAGKNFFCLNKTLHIHIQVTHPQPQLLSHAYMYYLFDKCSCVVHSSEVFNQATSLVLYNNSSILLELSNLILFHLIRWNGPIFADPLLCFSYQFRCWVTLHVVPWSTMGNFKKIKYLSANCRINCQ